MKHNLLLILLAVASACLLPAGRAAAIAAAIRMGRLQFIPPKNFEPQRPRSQIVAYEFSIPPAEGDQRPGRMTVMTAGGTVQQNVDRWIAQFTDDSERKKEANVEKTSIDGREVHFVDISGTYDDKPAPFAPGEKRSNYRMLGAIIPMEEGAVYFKLYGPRRTVSDNRDAFRAMIEEGLRKR
jgi:hypothetical protein